MLALYGESDAGAASDTGGLSETGAFSDASGEALPPKGAAGDKVVVVDSDDGDMALVSDDEDTALFSDASEYSVDEDCFDDEEDEPSDGYGREPDEFAEAIDFPKVRFC